MLFDTVYSDLLIIGNGVAGLRAAAAAAEKGVKALVVSKGPSASPEIMGFNAPVLPEDSTDLYFADMERSGYGINDSRLAKILSERVLPEVEWLENNGVHFARDEKGLYSPIHTLGTTYPRLIRAGVSSGSVEMKALKDICEKNNIKVDIPVDILGLLKDGNKVIGAWGIKRGMLMRYLAKAVVLATGGCGALQSFTTYPKEIIGDGYAMAYEVGASLVDMEIQQFEPCCFVYPDSIRGKVIATTLLRHGAELRNGLREPFLEKYGLSRDNAQKGNLSRAMNSEVMAGRGTPHGGIYYDMTMFDADFLYKDHAIFTRPAQQVGMDLTKEMPEMMPAAHTNLGGVIIDGNAMTQLEGLFACGEVIGGLHGGNRLGGSAGAETVVFGHLAGDSASDYVLSHSEEQTEGSFDEVISKMEMLGNRGSVNHSASIRERLGICMTKNLGIVRNAETIKCCAKEIKELRTLLDASGAETLADAASIIHCEHMLTLAEMQVRASDMRKESRGVFYREDYPETDETNWRKNIVIRKTTEGMELSTRRAIKETSF